LALSRITQKSVVDAVLDQVRALILDGELGPKNDLPPETTLAKKLGVSRQSVREAMRILLGEGLVEIRQGDGIYVREPSSEDCIRPGVLQLMLASEELWEIQEIRRVLEPEIAANAAERGTEEDFDSAEKILRRMRDRASRNESVFELAWEFHLAIASASGNKSMTKLIGVVYRMIRAGEKPLHDRYFDPWQEIRDHGELLATIRRREPALAREAMRRHLDSVDDRLASSLNAGTEFGGPANPSSDGEHAN
jgi:GntR family transcriptional repressor for pyruvate dehydrogenase complex